MKLTLFKPSIFTVLQIALFKIKFPRASLIINSVIYEKLYNNPPFSYFECLWGRE